MVNRPNTGVVNRPNNNNNVSGNWFGNRNVTNINNNYFGGGGWGHGGWGGYGPGRWGGYRPWASPYYGYHGGWYYGSWNRNYFGNAFWGGFTGAMLGNMAYGMFNLFPTWGSYGYSSWGLQPIVANSYYANYSNPYYSMPVAVVGQSAPTIVYNYNQPLATVADTSQAQPNQVESAETTFTQAREAFKAGDFSRAMILSDQAIAAVPGDSAMHEFRALCLYALKRYDEASAVLYSVLTAGPGWSWSTMIGLYADADVYTQQLRELEAYVRANPNSASARFDLAYHYMTQGHTESAAEQFTAVTALQPKDELSAKFVKALTPPAGAEAAVAANPPAPGAEAPAEPAAETEQPEPAPPPANMAGVWNAKPDPTLDITLDLKEGGDFTWKVQPKTGQPQTISGKAYFRDGQLALTQEQGAPLVGQVETPDAHTLKFTLAGGENAPTLVFKK